VIFIPTTHKHIHTLTPTSASKCVPYYMDNDYEGEGLNWDMLRLMTSSQTPQYQGTCRLPLKSTN
jgi:hypothetical protein